MLSHVSIHAPARGATPVVSGSKVMCLFQSTHPHGVRRMVSKPNLSYSGFNPRTRTGCDFFVFAFLCLFCWFQSTHPHGVRLKLFSNLKPQSDVSIHAPARGATPYQPDANGKAKFQSTHPHGVRQPSMRQKRQTTSFNPRTRTGCDKRSANLFHFAVVSIHAPARGATAVK